MTKLRSLVFAAFLALPLASFAEVDFSVNIAPPVLPVVEQPPCPVAGYIWNPGYWAVRERLLLGPRRLGPSAISGSALDTAVVGLEKRRLRV